MSAPTIAELTPDGTLKTIYTATGFTEINSLIQGSDGNFYGTVSHMDDGISFNPSSIFKFTLSGEFSVLHTFSGPMVFTPAACCKHPTAIFMASLCKGALVTPAVRTALELYSS